VCRYIICSRIKGQQYRRLPARALNAAAGGSAAPSTAIIDPCGGRRARGGGARAHN